MVDDSEAAFTRIKNQTRINEIKRAKRKWQVNKAKNILKWTTILVVTFLLVFYPVQTGAVIGTFIHEFFGTIINKAQGI